MEFLKEFWRDMDRPSRIGLVVAAAIVLAVTIGHFSGPNCPICGSEPKRSIVYQGVNVFFCSFSESHRWTE